MDLCSIYLNFQNPNQIEEGFDLLDFECQSNPNQLKNEDIYQESNYELKTPKKVKLCDAHDFSTK